jgi:inner membrane protein
MDPVTQGVLGAVLPQSFAAPERQRLALGAGWLGGMAADLDVLIRSSRDPLLAIEYHRHFTHALAFVPVGGLIVAAALWPLVRRRTDFRTLAAFTTLGYATHGLLDACTSYGTQLLWPFADTRVAWNVVGIVDPFYTVPLLGLAGLAAWTRRARFARVALGFAVAYLLGGLWQRERATAVAEALAGERGHAPAALTVKPTVGNLLLWRSLYMAEGRWHVDAVRVGLDARVYPGGSVAPAVLPDAPPGSALAHDLARFAWFSADALAVHPAQPDLIGDLRFSMLPNGLTPLWGIRVGTTGPDEHVPFVNVRDVSSRDFATFLDMVLGKELPGSVAR